MKSFPPYFNAKNLDGIREIREDEYEEEQSEMMIKERKRIVMLVGEALRIGARSCCFDLDSCLSTDNQIQLIREICDRFPGLVFYQLPRFDKTSFPMEWSLIQDGRNPPPSIEYKISF